MAYSVIALKFSCQIHRWPQLVNRPSVTRSHLLQKKNVLFSNTYVLASGYFSEFYIRKVLRGPSSSALKSGTWDLGSGSHGCKFGSFTDQLCDFKEIS